MHEHHKYDDDHSALVGVQTDFSAPAASPEAEGQHLNHDREPSCRFEDDVGDDQDHHHGGGGGGGPTSTSEHSSVITPEQAAAAALAQRKAMAAQLARPHLQQMHAHGGSGRPELNMSRPPLPTRSQSHDHHGLAPLHTAAHRTRRDSLSADGGMSSPPAHHQRFGRPGRNGARGGVSGNPPAWYSHSEHVESRRRMITIVARVLTSRKSAAQSHAQGNDGASRSSNWMQSVIKMARRLEEALFRSAHSLEEYEDTSTLKYRLQMLGSAMSMRQRNPSTLFGPRLSRARQLAHWCGEEMAQRQSAETGPRHVE